MKTVLVIEDEPVYVEALELVLEQEGFSVAAAFDGRSALVAFAEHRPDVVLLDLMLPELSGLDVLRTLRQSSSTPVIVVSAKSREADIVSALELGADDYITKPYSARELVARINAVARRGGRPASADGLRRLGDVALDPARYELRVGDSVTQLPRKEFELLDLLMTEAGRIVTRASLLEEVWGYGWSDSKSLDQHIRRLRRKIEQAEHGPTIETVRGVGYRLEPPR